MRRLDYDTVKRGFFKGKNSLRKLLKVSLQLFEAKQTGILFGTNHTQIKFLPTHMWDRGVMDRFDGRGFYGLILKLFGKRIVTAKGLSPIMFQKKDEEGGLVDNDGIIAYVLRNYANYYKQGINVIICPRTDKYVSLSEKPFLEIPFFVYDGKRISKSEVSIQVNTRIVKHFKSSNSIYIYLPDYGILVINTANQDLLKIKNDLFENEAELNLRLDILIDLVEASSLAYLGQLTGRKGAQLLWNKEKHLRKTSRDLIENEKRYRDLYENAPIAYISLDPDGIILNCNRKALQLSGYAASELIGRNARDLFARARGADLFLHSLSKGRVLKDKELKITVRDNQSIWVSMSVDAVRDSNGRITELRMMILDISRRKLLESQLMQSQKMEAIGTLAGGIAHDFNNILSPIFGYAEMMLMDAIDDTPEKEHLETILDCANHAKELVSQILTFGRKKEHALIAVDSSKAIMDSLSLIRSVLPATIRLETKIYDDCYTIMADPVQLHQVMMNLVTNACHAMKNISDGCISISLENVDQPPSFMDAGHSGKSYVRLSVSDTGSGIENEHIDKIFDPYFSTKKEGDGSGIGLSVVHGIVESHGGFIQVESREGKGTRFDIYLPQSHEIIAAEHTLNEPAEIEKGCERVLLVDDDRKVAMMETHMLKKLGYSVSCFTNSTNAVKEIKNNPNLFDLIITDMTMPDINGIQLADMIYRIKPELPVILCTGLGETLEKKEYHLPSIKALLKKPVAIRDLSRAMRSALSG